MISVEAVVSQQFPHVQHSSLRRPLIGFLRYLFHEREFQSFEASYPQLSGFDFVEQALGYFDFGYSVSDRERMRIPAQGRVVIIANHPIGSLDGLALLKLVGEVRRDVKAVANEMLMAIQPLHDLLLPVDNMNGRTARENLRAIEQHLDNEGAVVFFPAGEVSRFGPQGVRDGRWRSGFLRMARRTQAPILPVHVDARNSIFFYSLSLVAKPLSTLWLVREMFKQAKRTVPVRVGKPVPYALYDSVPVDLEGKVKLFKKHVYKLARNGGLRAFQPDTDTIAHPEPRQQLRADIRACEKLGETRDGMHIHLYRFQADSTVMREIGRLREISFRAVGEGTGLRRDVDRYDRDYDHILLWDDEELELVGAYRLVRCSTQPNLDSLYSSTLFDYQEDAKALLRDGVELGRSFVQPRYWGMRSLDYLWFGIGAYLKKHPEVRYLFGPVSISNSMPVPARRMLVNFYSRYFPASQSWASPRTPFVSEAQPEETYSGEDYNAEFTRLKQSLKALGVSVPTLYKQYSELCEPGGVEFAGFNVDAEFADCIDGLVIVDLDYLKPARRKRYLS